MNGKPVTERQQLAGMLEGVTGSQDWEKLTVREFGPAVILETGPDDAAAVFLFDEHGALVAVSVVEAHPDFAVSMWEHRAENGSGEIS